MKFKETIHVEAKLRSSKNIRQMVELVLCEERSINPEEAIEIRVLSSSSIACKDSLRDV